MNRDRNELNILFLANREMAESSLNNNTTLTQSAACVATSIPTAAAAGITGSKRSFQSLTCSSSNVTSTNYNCTLCSMVFTGRDPFEQHLRGSKHRGNERPGKGDSFLSQHYPPSLVAVPSCAICNRTFTSTDQYEAHVIGLKHKKKAAAVNVPPLMNNAYRCGVCDVCCTSKDQFDIHLNGKKHMKRSQQ